MGMSTFFFEKNKVRILCELSENSISDKMGTMNEKWLMIGLRYIVKELFMQQQDFVLEEYINKGIQDIMKDIVKATFKDPAESIFMAKFALAVKKGVEIRKGYDDNGEHIPPFLIASITSSCNLHCKGCYARENHICSDEAVSNQLTAAEWNQIFVQAKGLGINFVLLVGGEPMMRPDVLMEAAKHPEILFPVFTNGTIMNEQYLQFFKKNRNMVPIISVEGHKEVTDERRGEGTYQQLDNTMQQLHDAHLLFGASITVTRENMQEVLSDAFVQELLDKGCRAILYIEYVPVDEKSMELAPTPKDNAYIEETVSKLRKNFDKTLFISFPGDEHKSGGCLAAGRGFFHINVHGGAEPCPASPFSDRNVKEIGLREALKSPLFQVLRDEEILLEDHAGGCVLFDNREKVEALLQRNKK